MLQFSTRNKYKQKPSSTVLPVVYYCTLNTFKVENYPHMHCMERNTLAKKRNDRRRDYKYSPFIK